MRRTWQVGAGIDPIQTLPALTETLLSQRGVDADVRSQFFEPTVAGSLHDPYQLSGMREAVARIRHAVKRGERILVYGDYDADGVCATAILVSLIRGLGGHVMPYLPHRLDDGYALNREVLEGLLSEFELLITADCGVSNVEEIEWLVHQGKAVIVTDHHERRDVLPPALAVIHPQLAEYPFRFLSGSGVAWKLAQAFLDDDAMSLVDLAALGTLADVVPLVGENRAIVKFGLARIRRLPRPGMRALLEACRIEQGRDLSVEDITFRVIPRLNAAGRMDHPQPALDVLLADSEGRAQRLVTQLNGYNQRRQTLTRRILREATDMLDVSLPFLFSANADWPAGVVGLVASRLAEQYARPAIVVGGNGRHAVGSARAPQGSNVLRLLQAGEKHLMKLGGHERAAGFSLAADRITTFYAALQEAEVAAEPTAAFQRADAIVDQGLLSFDLLELVNTLEPFGEANPKPRFVARGLRVLDARVVGKTQTHGRLVVAGPHEPVEAIGFDLAQDVMRLEQEADAVFSVGLNEFRGRRRMQLVLDEVAPAGGVEIRNS